MEEKRFYSHGKLMLCGEYAVLKGATAFALPTIAGQSLSVISEKSDLPELNWTGLDKNGNEWFSAKLSLPHLILLSCSDWAIGIQLVRFLTNARVLNPAFLIGDEKVNVCTQLDFDLDEGLGSSSTLTNNIAQWAEINPFSLHFNAFKGSGFDVAVAKESQALLYTMKGNLPTVKTLKWERNFADKLYFIHLNRKQISRDDIAKTNLNFTVSQIAQISRISQLIAVNEDYFEFCLLLELIENEISQAIGRPCIKQAEFPDFKGSIKSLGAWGGDYILATGEDVVAYFENKNYNRIVPYKEMILQ